MGRGDYERLTPEAIDQLWIRMRAGHAPKPTARELGLSTSTVRDYLYRCGGIRPVPRRRAEGRLSAAEAFALSQLDERYQAEHWGEDDEAAARARAMGAELAAVERFIRLSKP